MASIADPGVFLNYQGDGRTQVEAVVGVEGFRGQIGHNIPSTPGNQMGPELVIVDKVTGIPYHYVSMEGLEFKPWNSADTYPVNWPVIYQGKLRFSNKPSNNNHTPEDGSEGGEWWGAPRSMAQLLKFMFDTFYGASA